MEGQVERAVAKLVAGCTACNTASVTARDNSSHEADTFTISVKG